MLRSIRGRETSLGPLLLKERRESVTGVFAAPVRPKTFDFNAVLRVCPSRELLVCIESLILGTQDVELRITCAVISKCDIVFSTSETQRG